MTQPVLKIDENATIREAVALMDRTRVGSLLVTRMGRDVGIVTERDIISKVILHNETSDTVTMKEILSLPLVTADANTAGEDALRIMVKHSVRRLPITDRGKIVGIFTTSDVTKLVNW
jgi:CBS domain-containing protein